MECRYWIEYEEDHNCSLLAVENNGPMKLQQIADRMKLTAPRIKQIESELFKKMRKNKSILRIVYGDDVNSPLNVEINE